MDTIAVIGLGYVGMPLAVEFAKKMPVIGYDKDEQKIARYLAGEDPTNEVGNQAIAETTTIFTNDETLLSQAKFFIVAVPTPIKEDKSPDLEPLLDASRTVGRHMKKGAIIVYESTVYPGLTESKCREVLEESSGLQWRKDFFIGYSPERINPGDNVHNLANIKKIVAGDTKETRQSIAALYGQIIKAGIYPVDSIAVAEAAKVAENTQRDINIAFMNELALVLEKMNLDTTAVVEAMDTKWNSLGFRPGLVGGHCIGVDPYYLVYQSERAGYYPQMIAVGRKLNDSMGRIVADEAIRKMIGAGKIIPGSRVGVFGITFKENCPDVRNSKVYDIICELKEFHCEVCVFDPVADPHETKRQYGITLLPMREANNLDCAIFAVFHREFDRYRKEKVLESIYRSGDRVLIDVKGMFTNMRLGEKRYAYWSL